MITQRAQVGWLITGDALAVLVVTIIGFLTHYGDTQGWRWLTTFLPVLAAWLLVAPWVGVYRTDLACQPRQLWRPVLAALFSAPLAATLRGAWLNSAVLPLFVGVLGLTNALGFLIWRAIWAFGVQRVIRQAGTVHG